MEPYLANSMFYSSTPFTLPNALDARFDLVWLVLPHRGGFRLRLILFGIGCISPDYLPLFVLICEQAILFVDSHRPFV
jgi:hypothetical protein